jgi:DNA modification methylase
LARRRPRGKPTFRHVRSGGKNGGVERFLLQRSAELADQQLDGEEPVHFTESFARTVVEELSAAGDRVLDPFAGFGTTLVVAERLGRVPIGIELLRERVEIVRRRLRNPDAVIRGDARRLAELVDQPVALVLTSPPYRARNDHPEDPLTGYADEGGNYDSYLAELGTIFGQVTQLLVPGGHLVVNAANIWQSGLLTPLAWDIARVVGSHLTFVQDCYLAWDSQPADISGDYALVFRRDL